jgi:hypothetical protein
MRERRTALAAEALMAARPRPIETVRARIAEVVGHVAVPYKVRTWHPAIERLIKEDEKRRERRLADPYPMSWDNSLFETLRHQLDAVGFVS